MEKLIRFIQKMFTEKFYGCDTIKFENGKATHIEMMSSRKRDYKDLPQT